MANLEPMPISSLPEGDIQDGDKAIIYRESTGKAYQTTGLAELNADLTDLYKLPMYYFASTSDVCEQVMSLLDNDPHILFGRVAATSDTGLPTNGNYFIFAFKWSGTTYADVFAIGLGTISRLYRKCLNNGTWGNWYQYTGTSVSTTSVGDPVVMGDNAED